MIDIAGKLYISTISDDAAELAREHGLGLEIAEFCTAFNMDEGFEWWDKRVKTQMSGLGSFIFHAPFNELCPAAIDPMVVEIAKKRYAQAYGLMNGYGIDTMVVHSGFLPVLYDENWFVSNSVEFWKEFLKDKPDGFKLYLENVFERTPEILCRIVAAVNDSRFRLCFDAGHAEIYRSGISLIEWTELVLPYLGHVHLHNNDGNQDSHNALGDGAADIASVLQTILGEMRDVTFTIEAVDGKLSVDWLREKGFVA